MTTIGKRLGAVAALVRPGVVLADVGTDHAYLPVFLVGSGHNPRAVASDINRGPLSRAAQTIAAAGLSDRIDTVLTDGLAGIEPYAPRDIVIAGMGGELIVKILSDTPFVRDPDVRLILQPMTRSAALRRFLASEGFAAEDHLCREDRVYEILTAQYGVPPYKLTEAEALVGKTCLAGNDPLASERLRTELRHLRRKTEGLQRAGENTDDLRRLTAELEEALCRSERFTNI